MGRVVLAFIEKHLQARPHSQQDPAITPGDERRDIRQRARQRGTPEGCEETGSQRGLNFSLNPRRP